MRRFALLSLTLAMPAVLSGCDYAGSPFESFGNFIGDTHTVSLNPNRPVGDSENLRRVTGRGVSIDPLLPEPGNVWPGPSKPDPTLEDIERSQNQPLGSGTPPPPPPGMDQPVAPHPQPRPDGPPVQAGRRGSSSPPTAEAPVPQVSPYAAAPNRQPAQPPPRSGTIQTPQGPAALSSGGGGVQTYTPPTGGGVGLVVPNGNGTSTLIGPDGSVQTVPSPR
jgi:hypothetical protein